MWSIDPGDAIPIWRQIEEAVRHRVASGALAAGDPLPSVRDLARELRVNPLTVSKAYQELVTAGILEVRRGQGTFVALAPPRMSDEQRGARLGEAARRYVAVARNLGAELGPTHQAVDDAWDDFERGET